MKTYDLVVLGGGTAGTAAARTAVRRGASVCLFNAGELGGLCILRGCMPTKTMLFAAHRAHEARESEAPGVTTRLESIDFPAVMRNKDAKVERFKRAKVAGIEADGYPVIDAHVRFTGPDTVEADGETYRFTKGAVIATGSVSAVPPIPGLDQVSYWTSDEVMALTEQPRSLITLGSGAIGLELSQFFARLGTRVELVSRRRVAISIDPLIADEMERALRDEPNLNLHAPAPPSALERTESGVAMTLADGTRLEAEGLLLATGRRARVDDLDLERAGVDLDERGRLRIGPTLRTSNPKVFAAGDATGERLLLHVANEEGAVAALNALEGTEDHRTDERLSLDAIFTEPTLATVGRTEAQAREAGLDVVTAATRYPETGRAITMEVHHGVAKLVAERASGELVGAQLLGPRADDLVHTLMVVLRYRGTAADLVGMPWYHPTLSEVFLSLARDLESQRA